MTSTPTTSPPRTPTCTAATGLPAPASPARRSARHAHGFTITELLISMLVFGIIGAIAFSLYGNTAKLVANDEGRIATNQNLRTNLDLITQDLREAGESLSTNYKFSGIDFDLGGNGLTIRKGISLPVLSVCQTITSNVTSLQVVGKPSDAGSVPAQCTYSDAGSPGDVDTPNGVSDKIDPWVTFKAQSGNTYIPAILYDPQTQAATRVQIKAIVNTANTTVLTLSPNSNVSRFSWSTGSVVVPVDERRYFLVGNELRLIVNEDPDSAQSLGYGLSSMTFLATTKTGGVTNTYTSFNLKSPWASVYRVDLTLNGSNVVAGTSNVARTVTASVFPRNVIQAVQ